MGEITRGNQTHSASLTSQAKKEKCGRAAVQLMFNVDSRPYGFVFINEDSRQIQVETQVA